MTSPRRFEQDLPALLADLYLAGTPDYRDDLVRQVDRVRQRPAWTFPERWLPVDIATQPGVRPALPWRQLGVLALVAMLLAAALAAYIGSRPRLPEPFGPAANGLIAYSSGGDIFAVDPTTGTSQALTTGPGQDSEPQFSPDGLSIALRRIDPGAEGRLLIVPAIRSGQQAVDLGRIETDGPFAWAPDSQWILTLTAAGVLQHRDVDGSEPVDIGADVEIGQHSADFAPFRPPDGREILYVRPDDGASALWVMNADGSDRRQIASPTPVIQHADYTAAKWSPDGTQIAFRATPAGDDAAAVRVFVMDADGSNLRQVSTGEGTWVENDLRWSPDSTRIAFNRWRRDDTGEWKVGRIGIATVATAEMIETGELPTADGSLFEWSPDGFVLIAVPGALVGDRTRVDSVTLIQTTNGVSTELERRVSTTVSWQRLAP